MMRMIIKILILLLHGSIIAQSFEWDCENGAITDTFTVNNYDNGAATLSSTFAHSGTYSVRIAYPNNEAGVELHAAFDSSASLFVRKYEYYGSEWSGNWPIGLKTSRYFTNPNAANNGSSPNAYAYMSEKLIWQTYDADCDELYGEGYNNAIYNLDLEGQYALTDTFGNGYPQIRTGHWYKYETWMVLNSDVDEADGVLKVWIDDVQVYSNETVVWRSSSRGCPNGTAWHYMWFGGNYSGATCGNPSETLYRYIDDFYISSTPDTSDTSQSEEAVSQKKTDVSSVTEDSN